MADIQWLLLTPHFVLSAGIVLAMLLVAWKRSQGLIASFTFVVLLLTLFATVTSLGQPSDHVTPLVKVDDFSRLTLMLILLSALFSCLISVKRLSQDIEVHDEYYLLLLLATLGGAILVVSDHYAALFLGFELLSLSLVGLAGYFRASNHQVEVAFKYLILSASASSFMLLGIAFLYAQLGSMSFSADITAVNPNNLVLMLGGLLLLSGMLFKLSIFPFHMWTPDVYQGAATPITFVLATLSKIAILTVLLKCFFSNGFGYIFQQSALLNILSVFAILSMFFGNTMALKQSNVKRLLAYSSIAHLGYLLILLFIGNSGLEQGVKVSLVYLLAYLLANIAVFTVISTVENVRHSTNEKAIEVKDFDGLFWQQPILAGVLIFGVLGLAGIPLTLGFVGKFYLMALATNTSLWWLLAGLIIGSGISLAYYLPIVFSLFKDREKTRSIHFTLNTLLSFALVFFLLFSLVVGLYPDAVTQFLIASR